MNSTKGKMYVHLETSIHITVLFKSEKEEEFSSSWVNFQPLNKATENLTAAEVNSY